MESMKNHISEADQRLASLVQMQKHLANVEELASTYEDDHNRMEFFRMDILPLMKCSICLSTLMEPALYVS